MTAFCVPLVVALALAPGRGPPAAEADGDALGRAPAQLSAAQPTADEQARVDAALEADLPDSDGKLTVDVDRWVLHDVLLGGPAQRPLPMAAADTAAAPPPQRPVPVPWEARIARLRLEARLAGDPEQHHRSDALDIDIPLANHPLVDLYIDYFTGRGRWFFQTWLGRAGRYVPLMQAILARHGLPRDLVYVAMIESGFSARATSSAAAAGFWQFMPSTGRLFGLHHDTWVDERRDFVRATEAACAYLARLYAEMGDWHLAWASYNAGEGRIRRAMARTGSRDFWELIDVKGSVAKETAHYVPKVIAAAMVAKDPGRYGFAPAVALPPLAFDEVGVDGAFDLRVVARRAGLAVDALRELNPSLLYDITPPHAGTRLRVPEGHGAQVAQVLGSLPARLRLSYHVHRVRRGDTLSAIAHRYRTATATILEFNAGLQAHRLGVGRELLIPSLPRPAQVAPLAAGRARRGARHVVSRGETLWSIARRYGVSVDRIRGRRSPRRQLIAVGEVLRIE